MAKIESEICKDVIDPKRDRLMRQGGYVEGDKDVVIMLAPKWALRTNLERFFKQEFYENPDNFIQTACISDLNSIVIRNSS
jgi:hypothetical protein